MNEGGQGRGGPPTSSVMALLGTVFLTYRRQRQQQISPVGASVKHFYVLRQLERSEVLRPSDIARMLYCDRPTATVVIGTMVKHGWVTREEDPQNGKQVLIRMTPGGRQKLSELRALAEGADTPDPLDGLSEGEVDALRASLTKIQRNLDRTKAPRP